MRNVTRIVVRSCGGGGSEVDGGSGVDRVGWKVTSEFSMVVAEFVEHVISSPPVEDEKPDEKTGPSVLKE